MATKPEETAATWTPPTYDMTHAPSVRQSFHPASKSSLGSRNFARTVKWSPDGADLLVQCEDHTLQLFPVSDLSMPRVLHHPAPLVDYAWFPYASEKNPATYCFLTSVRETPVKLIDAKDGRLRGTYSIVDHRERQIAPHCLAFTPFGERIYCGFEDAVEIFDLSIPGSEGTRMRTTPSKKTKDGLKGIISSIAFSGSTFAAGSLTPAPGNIAMYDERQGDVPIMYLEGGPAQPRGVTRLQFNPTSTHMLYASYRRHPSIHAWDLRNSAESFASFSQEINGTESRSTTNHKISFDIDKSGSWISVGTADGRVVVFDSLGNEKPTSESADKEPHPLVRAPILGFPAHTDVVPCVAFSPTASVLCSLSGSRDFEETESESESSDDDAENGEKGILYPARKPLPGVKDSSIKLWDLSSAEKDF